ncbi:hypothetical protein RRG08_056829 [Elysia crispata]|uniref:Uncharacterized protein n=1 Tax=Elysia crispata TaxID=231223 RepID=A0AAE1DVU9_9GAST|nr:hypothetical protein RRG08_056829 [Elysia crispata]
MHVSWNQGLPPGYDIVLKRACTFTKLAGCQGWSSGEKKRIEYQIFVDLPGQGRADACSAVFTSSERHRNLRSLHDQMAFYRSQLVAGKLPRQPAAHHVNEPCRLRD